MKREPPKMFTDDELENWDPERFGDALFSHFDAFGPGDWIDIKREALRVYNLMFCDANEPVEDDSGIDYWLAAAVNASAFGAMSAVCKMLGLDSYYFKAVLENWYEKVHGSNTPRPISFAELTARIEQERLRDPGKEWEHC